MDGLFAKADELETISTVVDALDDAVVRALTAGVVFVICGDVEAADTNENYAKLLTLLKPKPQQVIRADELGVPIDEEQATQVLNDVSEFLEVHRLSEQHVDQAGSLRDAIENNDTIAGGLEGLADRNAQQAATHVASLVKILTAQLQQSFVFLSFKVEWTPFLIDLKKQVGKWVLLDIPDITNSACLLGGGQGAVMLTGTMSSLSLVVILSCCCCKSAYNRRKWTHDGDEEAAARAGHAANFGWALYTLTSPAAVENLIKMSRTNMSKPALLLAAPLVLLVPMFAFSRLRRGAKDGILHSRAFEARYGWLCARCADAIIVYCRQHFVPHYGSFVYTTLAVRRRSHCWLAVLLDFLPSLHLRALADTALKPTFGSWLCSWRVS